MISAPILNGFWDPLGLHFATIFGFQKWIEKHPSSEDPCRDTKWKTKHPKVMQNGAQVPPKWSQNGTKMKRNGSEPG